MRRAVELNDGRALTGGSSRKGASQTRVPCSLQAASHCRSTTSWGQRLLLRLISCSFWVSASPSTSTCVTVRLRVGVYLQGSCSHAKAAVVGARYACKPVLSARPTSSHPAHRPPPSSTTCATCSLNARLSPEVLTTRPWAQEPRQLSMLRLPIGAIVLFL